jgi:hypothetical protein
MASAGFGNLDGGAQQAYQFRARFIRPLGTEVEMASTDGAHYVRVGAGGVSMSAFPTVPGILQEQVLGTNAENTIIRGLRYTEVDEPGTIVRRTNTGRVQALGFTDVAMPENHMPFCFQGEEHTLDPILATHQAVAQRSVVLRTHLGGTEVVDLSVTAGLTAGNIVTGNIGCNAVTAAANGTFGGTVTAQNLTYTGSLTGPGLPTGGLPWAAFSNPFPNNIDIYSGGNLAYRAVVTNNPAQNNPVSGTLSYAGVPVLQWKRRDFWATPPTPNLNHRVEFPAGGRFFIQWQMNKNSLADIGAPFEACIMANDDNNGLTNFWDNATGSMPNPSPIVGAVPLQKRVVAAAPTAAGAVTVLTAMEIFAPGEYITFKRNQYTPQIADYWNITLNWAKVFYLGPA